METPPLRLAGSATGAAALLGRSSTPPAPLPLPATSREPVALPLGSPLPRLARSAMAPPLAGATGRGPPPPGGLACPLSSSHSRPSSTDVSPAFPCAGLRRAVPASSSSPRAAPTRRFSTPRWAASLLRRHFPLVRQTATTRCRPPSSPVLPIHRRRCHIRPPVLLAAAGLSSMLLHLPATQLARSVQAMSKLSVARARFCAGSIADAKLREKLASGINVDDLKGVFDKVVIVLDAVSILRGGVQPLAQVQGLPCMGGSCGHGSD